MAQKMLALAPGARLLIRDEEWILRKADRVAFGGYELRVTGVSELVRGKESIFLTELDDFTELKPEETELVDDDSPRYRRARLFIESLLRRSPPTGTTLSIGHRAAIDPLQFQLQPAAKALGQPRARILMADGVGLGKTIEVGILLSELIRRGRGDRILVVALKSILPQFQEELWARFTIPLVRLDSVGIQRVQTRIPSNMNPFHYFDRVIVSIDTLKKDAKYRGFLEACRWDVIVIDECQNVAVRTRGGSTKHSQRARLAKLLSRTSDSLILTSATPHDGSAKSFASLMNLLEPTAVADEENFEREEVEDLFIRRFKKDIKDEVQDQFQDRKYDLIKIPASPPEDASFEELTKLSFHTIDQKRGSGGVLFRTTLLKSFLSSPTACISTIDARLEHKDVKDPDDPAAKKDRESLTSLRDTVESITPKHFGKLQRLIERLQAIGFDKKNCKERVVVFSERIPTLVFLHKQLLEALGLKEDAIEVFHGSDDQKLTSIIQKLGTENSPIRILLASDAASEGINLHYHCHRLIHFDLPWSLITLNQRNGRIDRYGQKHPPEIDYFLTIPGDPSLEGDLRVLERLIEKEDAAHKNLGDAAWLMNLHDEAKEEERIAQGIEEHEAAEAIIPEEPAHTDFLELLFGDDRPEGEARPECSTPLSLFENDLDYAREAFEQTLGNNSDAIDWHDNVQGFTLRPPADIKRRFDYLPSELRRDGATSKLTIDRKRVMQALEDSRQDEDKWPEWQLFWELHPVAKWLDDRVLSEFDRHEAPIIHVPAGLQAGESVFLMQGVLVNQRGQLVVTEWFGVPFVDGEAQAIQSMQDWAEQTGLSRTIPNPGTKASFEIVDRLKSLRQGAVTAGQEHLKQLRRDRSEALSKPLRDGQRRLIRWQQKCLKRISDALEKPDLPQRVRKQKAEEQHHIEETHPGTSWIDSLRTNPEPYIRLAAVLISQEN